MQANKLLPFLNWQTRQANPKAQISAHTDWIYKHPTGMSGVYCSPLPLGATKRLHQFKPGFQ